MAKGDKMVVNVYQISPVFIGDYSFDEIVNKMSGIINASKEKYIEQDLAAIDIGDFVVRIFYFNGNRIPSWRGFVYELLAEDSPMKRAMTFSNSFIMFIGFKDKIFVVTGGAGRFAIERFISYTFGIDIITRLIEKNSPVIKSLQDRGLTGPVFGQKKHFRSERRLSDENQFGSIYNEVKAELSKQKMSSLFEFKKSELKRDASGCLAKHSFTINKSISFDSFLKVLKSLSILLDKPANFVLNSVEKIERKKSLQRVSQLDAELVRLLYNNFLSGGIADFDFTHRDFDKYAEAACHCILNSDKPIKFDFHPALNDIEARLRKRIGNEINDEIDYKHFVLQAVVQSFTEDGDLLTTGKVIDHLHGELIVEGKSYFFLDGEWYLIKPNFIEELNKELEYQVKSYWDDSLITFPFDTAKDERDFNASFIGQSQTLVFDTITPQGIETCDILRFNDDYLYLVHVKKDFDNSIRDLSVQIMTAARRLQQDIKSDFSFIKELEKSVKKGNDSNSEYKRRLARQVFPIKGLVELFKGRKICFCFAFVDMAESGRVLKDHIQSFRSNIAKIALSGLIKEVTSLGFDFKVIQLKKKTDKQNGGQISQLNEYLSEGNK